MANIFGRKKQETAVKGPARVVTELEQLCGEDKETYEALMHTMFLDPRKVAIASKDASENARRFEKAKNDLMTKTWYEIAGGLAIYEGDAKKVSEYFGKCADLSQEMTYTILKDPERAVAKAQEYYKKMLKD